MNSEYHIFLEFKIPSGREIDFLIIAQHGAWLIEHKNYDFIEIKVNGNWKYLDYNGKVRTFIKKIRSSFENPYEQTINSADNFSDWLKSNNDIAPELKFQKKIFPCFAIPDSSTKILIDERDTWCYFSKGIDKIKENIEKRKWDEKDYISESIIKRIAEKLNLQQISFSDLMLHKANLEMIFRKTSEKQVDEIKKIMMETSQLTESNEWLYTVSLKAINGNGKDVELENIVFSSLPLILTGNCGSGKTIISYQIIEKLGKENLGFFIPLRDIDTSKDVNDVNNIIFKDRIHPCSIRLKQDVYENVEDELIDVISFLIQTIIQIYNEESMIDQIFKGITNYLQDRRFFFILDGWDEIHGSSISIIKKICSFFIENGISFIISCRSPIDSDLTELKIHGKAIPIYEPRELINTQIVLYLKKRLEKWNSSITEEKLLEILHATFKSNIIPFYLYAFTITPIMEIPKNSAQLLRWLIIAQIGWELLKDRTDFLRNIRNIQDVIQILEKERIPINDIEIPYYKAISDVKYNGTLDLTNASVNSILGKFALSEVHEKNKEIHVEPYLSLNPLIKPFIELRYHPNAYYSYPIIKTKLLEDYFIAEYALDEFIEKDIYGSLISIDVFWIFKQLLDIDDRWKSKFNGSEIEWQRNDILTQFLIKNPIQLKPTIQNPDFELIGGGMRTVQRRMRFGVPTWYKEILSACIEKVKEMHEEKFNGVNHVEIISAFISLQTSIPEQTFDTIYDSFIQDYDDGQFSQSREPEYYYSYILVIFREFQHLQPTIMKKIDQYKLLLKQKEKLAKRKSKLKNKKSDKNIDNKKYQDETKNGVSDQDKDDELDEEDEINWDEDEIWEMRIEDSFLFESKHYQKLFFLFSILEYSTNKGLTNWAKSVLRSLSWSGEFIEFLLCKSIHSSVLDVLLSKYAHLSSDWVDQELGCQMPPEWDFNEDIIIQSFIQNIKSKAPDSTLLLFWELLLDFSADLNLVDFLLDNGGLFNLNLYRNLLERTFQHDLHGKNAFLHLINANIAKFKEIFGQLNPQLILENIYFMFPLTNEDYQVLLNNNRIRYEIAVQKRQEYTKKKRESIKNFAKKERESIKNHDNNLQTSTAFERISQEMSFEDEPYQILDQKYKIHQLALLQELKVDESDLGASITKFDQIQWLLYLFELCFIKYNKELQDKIFSSLSAKILAFKNLLERKLLLPFKIAFCRLITYDICSIPLEKEDLMDKNAETWLRESEMFEDKVDEKALKQNRTLNEDWSNINNFINKNLPNLFQNPQFSLFFSDLIKKDANMDISPELLADLVFPFKERSDQKYNHYDWEAILSLLPTEFIEKVMEIAIHSGFIDTPIWMLALKSYNYHKLLISQLLISIFSKAQDEYNQINIHNSFLHKLSLMILELDLFDCFLQMTREIPIESIIYLILALRSFIFPENSEEIIQITPFISDSAKENLNQITSIIEAVIERLEQDITSLLSLEEFNSNFTYLFEIIVGIHPKNVKILLLLLLKNPIFDMDIGKWIFREKEAIFDGKNEFIPLIQNKIKQLTNQREKETQDYHNDELEKNVEILNEIITASNTESPSKFKFVTKIEFGKYTPRNAFDPNTYQPNTHTLDWTDFSEVTLHFSVKEKILLLLRLLFGRNLSVHGSKVKFIDHYFNRKNKKLFFPKDKDIGIHLLIDSFDEIALIKHVKLYLAKNPVYWHAFLLYLVDYWPVEQIESVLCVFSNDDITYLKIPLTCKYISEKMSNN